jgi:alpha,alpha-trehalase
MCVPAVVRNSSAGLGHGRPAAAQLVLYNNDVADVDDGLDLDPHVLREYSLIADGYRGALVSPRGDIAWMCFPSWESDAVLQSLLGGDGHYAVTPEEPAVWGGYYEDGSLIWRSRWVTRGHAIVESREALAFPGQAGTAVLLRRVLGRAGTTTVIVSLRLSADFGAAAMRDISCESGVWTGTTGGLHWRWSGADDAQVVDGPGGPVLRYRRTVAEGEWHDVVLELSERPLSGPPVDAGRAWQATEDSWRRDAPSFEGFVARRDVRLAHAVLRGMTRPQGGLVAAATMSLPERVDRARSYDYRYSWVRDQCFAGHAAAAAGALPLLDGAVDFVSDRLLADGPELAPAYTADGGPVPDQHHVGLPGYPGGTDIAGNHVNHQFQLDVFGEALCLFAAAADRDRLDSRGWQAVHVAARAIEEGMDRPDAGIWELDERWWSHSRLTCVAGLRAIARHVTGSEAGEWSAGADRLLAEVARRCTHPSGRWQRTPEDARVDAALLLPPIRGALPGDDPRTVATFEAIRTELTQDGYLYRYEHDARQLGHSEGAFLFCGFAMALACWQQGRRTSALRWFERNRAACGPPGLYAEEYDVAQRQLRGNLPQAFVHALLLECAAVIPPDGEPDEPDAGASLEGTARRLG